jgi:hypothetical protein
MKVLVRKCTRRMAHNGLLEWNGGNGKWYPINRDNILVEPDSSSEDPFDQNPLVRFEYWRKAYKKILNGQTEVFSGEYDREKKTLIIRKL